MRRQKDVKVEFGGPDYRDKGKVFRLTEMSATEAEGWALHALTLVAQAGVNLPDGIIRYGWAGLAILGIDALLKVDFAKAKPILDQMMSCVEIIPDPKVPIPHKIDDNDIEEVQTRLWLRDQVFELHSGFCVADAIREMLAPARMTTFSSQLDTQTSPPPSESASPVN